MKNTEVLLARQPIYDKYHQLYGFELLYRGINSLPQQPGKEQLQATLELLANACMNCHESEITMGLPMFVNVDEAFILSEALLPGPSNQLVLEILEHVEPTNAVISRLQKIREQGYRLALDDYAFEPERRAFLPYVSVIKVDIEKVDMGQLADNMRHLPAGKFVLLAEKVEDTQTMQECLDMGFDLFQGYYLERPTLISGQKVDASKQLLVRIVSELSRTDVSVEEVVDLLAQDPRLSYKILLLVNSPLYQFVGEISSLKGAVVALGLEAVKRWALILSFVVNSTRPLELFRTLLVRAKTMELAAEVDKELDASMCFLVGLLSGIDAVLENELATLVRYLKIPPDIKNALISNQSPLGKALEIAIGIERFDTTILEILSTQEAYVYNRCHRKAMRWADEVMSNVKF